VDEEMPKNVEAVLAYMEHSRPFAVPWEVCVASPGWVRRVDVEVVARFNGHHVCGGHSSISKNRGTKHYFGYFFFVFKLGQDIAFSML
jgi:hypothetical protein